MTTTPTPDILRSSSFRTPPHGFSKLRAGALVRTEVWVGAFADHRQILRATAVAGSARSAIVFSHVTAAALHGIPLSRPHDRVHIIPRGENPPKTRGDVIRHKLALPDGDIVEINGMLVTSLDRTVADVIRVLPAPAALAAFDGAMRLVAWDDARRELDQAAADAFRGRVRKRIFAARGGRGVRVARTLVEIADGRAQLPGESESRYLMWELGMPTPALQLPVDTSIGRFWLDFAWPALRRFGEFDGQVKTSEPRFTRGRSGPKVLVDQAERSKAIQAATGWTGMHWGWVERADAATLWASLVGQGWPTRARM
ncbi:hypothetical protein [Microbacterium kunmingense]|uniref:hypothetical protein n=1 Tax=Microbacterium kunmingense TaxID=2915939 RepID=UPI0020050011|nr:hypothetical protein [Microbacterium kunmingense]